MARWFDKISVFDVYRSWPGRVGSWNLGRQDAFGAEISVLRGAACWRRTGGDGTLQSCKRGSWYFEEKRVYGVWEGNIKKRSRILFQTL